MVAFNFPSLPAVGQGYSANGVDWVYNGYLWRLGLGTIASDTTPNAFSFTDQTNVALSTPIISNTITISGIDTASPLTITGGQYSINGGAFASAATTVVNGNTVAVRVTSSGTNSTAVSATLTIGGVSDTFTVTTLALVASPPTITSATNQTTPENTPFSLNLTASEAGTWAITGGADALMFDIAGSSTAAEAFDFELPEDANGDNIYDVQVTFTATATGLTDTKMFHVTVTNVAESGTTLAALTLSANAIVENSAAGTVVGAIVGQTPGSTLSLVADAGGRFAFQALSALTLSANTIPENSVAGTVVGTIVGQTPGSTITLTSNAGGRFGISP
jgi:hypothetical protein